MYIYGLLWSIPQQESSDTLNYEIHKTDVDKLTLLNKTWSTYTI